MCISFQELHMASSNNVLLCHGGGECCTLHCVFLMHLFCAAAALLLGSKWFVS